MPRLTKRQRPCKMFLFNNLAASPEWRNWQTRWTQNPVVLSTVWVRPPPPGPLSYVFIKSSVTIAMDRKKGPRFGDLGLGGQYKIANHIYHFRAVKPRRSGRGRRGYQACFSGLLIR